MNAIVSFPTSAPPQGDTAAQTNGSRDLGFAALLGSTAIKQEPYTPRAQVADRPADDRYPASESRFEPQSIQEQDGNSRSITEDNSKDNTQRSDQGADDKNSDEAAPPEFDHSKTEQTATDETTGASTSARNSDDKPAESGDVNTVAVGGGRGP